MSGDEPPRPGSVLSARERLDTRLEREKELQHAIDKLMVVVQSASPTSDAAQRQRGIVSQAIQRLREACYMEVLDA
jgi:hypothetical protein